MVITAVVSVSSPAITQGGAEQPSGSKYQSYFQGFFILLLLCLTLVGSILVYALRRQRRERRRRHTAHFKPVTRQVKYDFDSSDLPQHHHGSQSHPDQLKLLSDRHAWDVHSPDGGHEGVLLHTGVPHVSDESLIFVEKTAPSRKGWSRWLRMIRSPFKRLEPGLRQHANPTLMAYQSPPVAQRYQTPQHDPSISTNTGVRVSRWCMQCQTPSSSALFAPAPSFSSAKASEEYAQGQSHKVPFVQPPAGTKVKTVAISIPSQSPSFLCPTGKVTRCHYQALDQSPSSKPPKTTATGSLDAQRAPKSTSKWGPADLKLHKPSTANLPFRLPSSARSQSNSGRSPSRASFKNAYDDSSMLLAEDFVHEFDCDSRRHRSDSNPPLDRVTAPMGTPPKTFQGDSAGDAPPRLDSGGNSLAEGVGTSPIVLTKSQRRLRRKRDGGGSPKGPLFLGALVPPTGVARRHGEFASGQSSRTPGASLVLAKPLLTKKKNVPVSRLLQRPTLATPQVGAQGRSGNESKLDANLAHKKKRSTFGKDAEVTGGLLSMTQSESCLPMTKVGGTHDIKSDCQLMVHPPIDSLEDEEHLECLQGSVQRSCTTDEEVLFAGYRLAESIGNTGGVTELGLLRPRRESVYSSGIDDESSYRSGDLFYVKPRGQPSPGYGKLTLENLSGHRRSPRQERPSDPSQEDFRAGSGPSAFKQSSRKASDEIRTQHSQSSFGSVEKARASQITSGCDQDEDVIVRCQLVNNPYAPLSVHPKHRPEEVCARVQKSASTSRLGKLLPFGGAWRSVSSPLGSSHKPGDTLYRDVGSYLDHTCSPLARIAQKAHQPSKHFIGHDEGLALEEEAVPEDDEEADENSQLLVPEDPAKSVCSRRTLGQ